MTGAELCWICRKAPATTGEHSYPAAYLRRIDRDWKDMSHGSFDGRTFHTQSAGSDNFKLRVLCGACNNSRTAAQDRALDGFLKFALLSEDQIWSSRRVVLDHNPSRFHVLDLYRGLLKLEFSRHAACGYPVSPSVADFVLGGDDWQSAARVVRVKLRAVENLHGWSVKFPSESDLRLFGPFHVQQINFGWLGVHFVSVLDESDALPWGLFDLDNALVSSCLFVNGDLRPPF